MRCTESAGRGVSTIQNLPRRLGERGRSTFDMKNYGMVLVTVALLVLQGCNEPSEFGEGYGEFFAPSGNWKVTNSAGTRGLTVWTKGKDADFGSGCGPADWNSAPDAFVYFSPEDDVWVFDGRRKTFIVTAKGDRITMYGAETWPGKVPPAFEIKKAGIRSEIEL